MSEFRPGRFQILPTVIKNLLIINVLMYLAQVTLGRNGDQMSNILALHYWGSDLFRPHQFVTHLFMHDPSNLFHLFSNMFALWMFGSTLENVWGPKRFLIFYMICGIGAAFCHMLVLTYDNVTMQHYITAFQDNPTIETFRAFYENVPSAERGFGGYYNEMQGKSGPISPSLAGQLNYFMDVFQQGYRNVPTVGASGAVFGVLFAFGYLFPNSQLFIIPIPFPIKAKYFVGFYILMELFLGLRNSAGDNVAHFAHLGGVLFAYILLRIWNKRNRRSFY